MLDESSSFINSVTSRKKALLILMNIAIYICMIVILTLLINGNIEPSRFIYLKNVYLEIYRFSSRILSVAYLLLVKLRALKQINKYSLIRPHKLIRGIYIVIFIMLTILLFYLFIIIIFIPRTDETL
jgi:hypothetical protein